MNGVNFQDFEGNTALIIACMECDIEEANRLLDEGADVNL